MKIKWINGGLEIMPEKKPMFVDYLEHKQAEEDLKSCIARQRHQLFTVRKINTQRRK